MSQNLRAQIKKHISCGMALMSLTAAIPVAYGANGGTMTYEVPKGALLAEPLLVNLNRARLDVRGDVAVLDYQLPPELDGLTAKRFRLSGTQTEGQWSLSTGNADDFDASPSAVATCTGEERHFTCVMNYSKNEQGIFPLDTASAGAYLRTRGDLSPADIAKIKLAQTALSHEPIGIIRVRRH